MICLEMYGSGVLIGMELYRMTLIRRVLIAVELE